MTERYKLIGKLAVPSGDLIEWAKWMETAKRHVDLTKVGPLTVSTVFLGLDHRFRHDEGDPLLFETMIFGDLEDGYQERCSTWAQAEEQHAKAVRHAEEVVKRAGKLLDPPANEHSPGEPA